MGFSHSSYTVDEDGGSVQLVLALSNPSSTDVTVQVLSEDNTAIGEHYTLRKLLFLQVQGKLGVLHSSRDHSNKSSETREVAY